MLSCPYFHIWLRKWINTKIVLAHALIYCFIYYLFVTVNVIIQHLCTIKMLLKFLKGTFLYEYPVQSESFVTILIFCEGSNFNINNTLKNYILNQIVVCRISQIYIKNILIIFFKFTYVNVTFLGCQSYFKLLKYRH